MEDLFIAMLCALLVWSAGYVAYMISKEQKWFDQIRELEMENAPPQVINGYWTVGGKRLKDMDAKQKKRLFRFLTDKRFGLAVDELFL